MMPNDNTEVVRQHQMVDQVKAREETEENKHKLLTYLIRTVNYS